MTDDYKCQVFKTHAKSARRFSWQIAATGDWRAYVDCVKCDPPERIAEIANPELFADLLPPKPPVLRPML